MKRAWLARGAVALLLVGLAAAAIPYSEKHSPRSADVRLAKHMRRMLGSRTGPKSADTLTRKADSKAASKGITALTRMAAGRSKRAKAYRQKHAVRSSVGKRFKSSKVQSALRKVFAPSRVEQTAQMMRSQQAKPTSTATGEQGAHLRRHGGLDTGLTTDIKNAFIAYDTDARRQLLQLNPLQGTDSEKQMCKELGWDLVELYFDFVTGDEVQYNEGCSEDDLWMSGIMDWDGNCYKQPRTADLELNWESEATVAACWGNQEFSEYCSAADNAKCTYNGTKGRGTAVSGPKSWYVAGNSTHTGGPGFFLKARELVWKYQGNLHDSCQVVLFYDWDVSVTDTGEYAKAGSGGVAACENQKGYDPNWDEDDGSHLYPLMCSDGSTEKTSSQTGNTVSTRKVIESSYMRQLNGTHVPYDSWMTYEIWDGWCEDEEKAYAAQWTDANCEREHLINPARQPLNGNDLLREVVESVGMACVTDGADYCFKEFMGALRTLDTKLYPTLDGDTFGPTEVEKVEKILEEDICTTCNEKLMDYMYLTWSDATDDEKYERAYMELMCSMAPDDEGEMQWCLPVTKDMEDEDSPEMDEDSADYDEDEIDVYVEEQSDLWCDDLCVKTIKIKEKEMTRIDLNAEKSYECRVNGIPSKCSQAFIDAKEKQMEQEEVMESSYCGKLVRPAVGNETDPEYFFCMEMLELPWYLEKWEEFAKECMPSEDFDPFDPAQVSDLPASVTCTDECKAKFQAWIDPADGWGCCAPSLLNGFEVFDDLKKFSEHIGRLGTACGVDKPETCPVPDGGEVSVTFSVENFDDKYFNGLSSAEKTMLIKTTEENIADLVGVDRTSVSVQATAANEVLTVTCTVKASSASQGQKIVSLLEQFSSTRRQGRMKKIGMKKLTANPNVRRDKKLPVQATTSNVVANFKEVDENTPHAVIITVTMPYSKAEFDAAKQTSYKKAVAKVAATSEKNIRLTITEGARRAGSVKVETKILAGSSSRLAEIKKALGSDTDKLLAKLNKELKAQGLNDATGVTAPKDVPNLNFEGGGQVLAPSSWLGLAMAMVLMLGLAN